MTAGNASYPPRWTLRLVMVLLANALLWTVLPAIFFRCLPTDSAEAIYWGSEWPMGTYKHPPLPAWIAYAAFQLGGRQPWAIYLLSQVTIGVGVACVYALGKAMLSARIAFFAACSVLTFYYIGFAGPNFNHNIALLAFWNAAALTLHRALNTGGGRALAWWGLTGLLLGAAGLCKYPVVFLAACIGVLVFATPEGRRALRTPGPYLAVLLGLAVVTPHLLWIRDSGFVTLDYAGSRSGAGSRTFGVLSTLGFAGAVIGMTIPASVCLAALHFWPLALRTPGPGRDDTTIRPFDRRFLWVIGVGPIVLHILVGLVFNIVMIAAWSTAMLPLLPLVLLGSLRSSPWRRGGWLAFAGIVLAVAAMAVLQIMHSYRVPRWPSRSPRTTFPMRELSRLINERWEGRFPAAGPPATLIGDEWLVGGVAACMPDPPAVSAGFERVLREEPLDPRIDPWVTPEIINARGGVLIWKLPPDAPPGVSTMHAAMRRLFPAIVELDPLQLEYPGANPPQPIRIGIALIRPPGRS